MIGTEMKLKPSTLADLQAQMVSMQKERKDLLGRMAEIDEDLEMLQTLLSSTVTEKPATRATWIRLTLKGFAEPATAKQVAKEMLARGFQTDTPDDLWKTVGIELNRMSGSDDDPVTWVERGKYRFNGES